jgi:hypothetical protein
MQITGNAASFIFNLEYCCVKNIKMDSRNTVMVANYLFIN